MPINNSEQVENNWAPQVKKREADIVERCWKSKRKRSQYRIKRDRELFGALSAQKFEFDAKNIEIEQFKEEGIRMRH